jgi:hypothetical protein
MAEATEIGLTGEDVRSPFLALRQQVSAEHWPLCSALGPLTAVPEAPRLARMFTLQVLNGWGMDPMAGDAELIVGELAANAIGAASAPGGYLRADAMGGPPELWLLGNRAEVRLEVWDSVLARYGVPVLGHFGLGAESGRGLAIVAALSRSWGWGIAPDQRAKRVWALLEVPDGLPPVPSTLRWPVPGSSGNRRRVDCQPADPGPRTHPGNSQEQRRRCRYGRDHVNIHASNVA